MFVYSNDLYFIQIVIVPMTYCLKYEFLINHPLYSDLHYKNAIDSIPFKKYAVIDRDGNCLYSSISVVFYNYLLNNPNYYELLASYKAFFDNTGISEIVSETYLEALGDLLKEKKTCDLMDKYDWLMIIGLLRLITASYLKINENRFKDFMCCSGIESYIKTEIEPMGKRAGELEINVLAEFLNYQVNIFYLDADLFRTHSIGKGKTIVNLLFTPDHYELLMSDCI